MKKKILCPVCGTRLMDSNEKVKTLIIKEEEANKDTADYYIKCKGCKKIIGIKKIE